MRVREAMGRGKWTWLGDQRTVVRLLAPTTEFWTVIRTVLYTFAPTNATTGLPHRLAAVA